MRKIFLIVMIFTTLPIYSQEYLKGHYYNPQADLYAQGFHFKLDGTFDYYLANDVYEIVLGEGRYSLTEDRLTLYYEKVDTTEYLDSKKNKINLLDSSKVTDSLSFKINAYDRVDKSPLIGAIIELLDSNKNKLNDIYYTTNDFGKTQIILNKNLLPAILRISYIGYEDYFFYVQKGFNYKIELYFSPFSYYKYEFIKEGTISYFEYEYNTEDSFYIKGKNSNYWTPYTRREINYDE